MAKNKIIDIGIVLGAVAGVIDAALTVLTGGGTDKVLVAFTFWVAVGFFVSTSNIKVTGWLKGIIISLIILIPVAIPYAWSNRASVLSMILGTALIGGVLGRLFERFSK